MNTPAIMRSSTGKNNIKNHLLSVEDLIVTRKDPVDEFGDGEIRFLDVTRRVLQEVSHPLGDRLLRVFAGFERLPLLRLEKVLELCDGDALPVGAERREDVEKEPRKAEVLDDGAEVVEADVAAAADVVLPELLFEDVGRHLAVDLLHELLQLLQTDHSLFPGHFHVVEPFPEPPFLMKPAVF